MPGCAARARTPRRRWSDPTPGRAGPDHRPGRRSRCRRDRCVSRPGEQVRDPAWPPAPGLIDAQHRGRLRLGQLRGRGLGERRVRRRPGHPERVGDLGDTAGRITHRAPDRHAQPARAPPARRDLLDGLGERPPTAGRLTAAPTDPCANAPGSDPVRRADPSAR